MSSSAGALFLKAVQCRLAVWQKMRSECQTKVSDEASDEASTKRAHRCNCVRTKQHNTVCIPLHFRRKVLQMDW